MGLIRFRAASFKRFSYPEPLFSLRRQHRSRLPDFNCGGFARFVTDEVERDDPHLFENGIAA